MVHKFWKILGTLNFMSMTNFGMTAGAFLLRDGPVKMKLVVESPTSLKQNAEK